MSLRHQSGHLPKRATDEHYVLYVFFKRKVHTFPRIRGRFDYCHWRLAEF